MPTNRRYARSRERHLGHADERALAAVDLQLQAARRARRNVRRCRAWAVRHVPNASIGTVRVSNPPLGLRADQYMHGLLRDSSWIYSYPNSCDKSAYDEAYMFRL